MLRAFCLLIVALWPSLAVAQWMASSSDNPFDKTAQHFAFTAFDAAVFGISCRSEKQDPLLIFVLPETGATRPMADQLSAAWPKLAIIVDDDDAVEFDAAVDVVEMFGATRFRVKALDLGAIDTARAIAAAKRRVAVAARIAGQTLYPTTFGIAGSGREIRGVLAKCGF